MRTFKTAKGTELPIMDMRGKDYLEVKWRLVWFREDRPNWSIETEFVAMTDKDACAKALVRDESGRVIATGHKYENKAGFADYREKAETGAIGRALALIGYGTQFCADELDEGPRIVDGPIQRPASATQAQDPPRTVKPAVVPKAAGVKPRDPRTLLGIEIMENAAKLKLAAAGVNDWAMQEFNVGAAEMSIEQMKQFLEMIQVEQGRAGLFA